MGLIDVATFLEEASTGWATLLPFLSPNGGGSNPDPLPAAIPVSADDEPNDNDSSENFRQFIRRMIEIREILRAANFEDAISLPSIVVIGSQSSGKSSVLESIVGQEFLPKYSMPFISYSRRSRGNNMVTRRPLELTLVHSPGAERDFGVFPGMGPIYDFTQIQRILSDQNLAVPQDQWVSSEPVQLTIYSRNVPDLTLIDLPGYIQVSSRNQPAALRDQIAGLCEKYIQRENNILLAVCPADVDLANAEALKASKRVDPKGERTIGVITKLDLVDPKYASEIIRNEDYPLKLGYIGVVCKPSGLLSGLKKKDPESQYFTQNSAIFDSMRERTGIKSLRGLLTSTLEQNIASSLSDILFRVQEELAEVRYQLKAEYNDRVVSPEGYTSQLMTSVKGGLAQIASEFTRESVRHSVQGILRNQLLQVIEQYLAEEDRLDMSIAAMTRSGIGKKTSQAVADQLVKGLDSAFSSEPLSHHPEIKEKALSDLTDQLRQRARVAADMVENALKPYKYDFEFSSTEWKEAYDATLTVLKDHLSELSTRFNKIQDELGSKRLRKVIQYLADNKDSLDPESPALTGKAIQQLRQGKEAAELNHRIKILKKHLDHVTSQSKYRAIPQSWSTWLRSFVQTQPDIIVDAPCIKECPDVYLYILHERLLRTSALFVHHELVREFIEHLPSTLVPTDTQSSMAGRLLQGSVDKDTAMYFVRENPVVHRHIQLLERRAALERVRDKLVYLKQRKEEDDSYNK